MRTREEDVVNHLFVASTHSYMMIFTDRGRAYWLKVHEIPDVGADGRGKSIANLVQMDDGEKIASMVAVREFDDDHHVVMGTQQGHDQEDRAVGLRQPARRRHHRHGRRRRRRRDRGADLRRRRARSSSAPATAWPSASPKTTCGRWAAPPTACAASRLREGDEVVAMEVVKPGGTLLTVTELGYGKRTPLDEYRVQSRGGLGLKNVEITDKNGTRHRDRPGRRRQGTAAHHRAGQDSAHAHRATSARSAAPRRACG